MRLHISVRSFIQHNQQIYIKCNFYKQGSLSIFNFIQLLQLILSTQPNSIPCVLYYDLYMTFQQIGKVHKVVNFKGYFYSTNNFLGKLFLFMQKSHYKLYRNMQQYATIYPNPILYTFSNYNILLQRENTLLNKHDDAKMPL